MTILYVSNPTSQNIPFYYRRGKPKDNSTPAVVEIASGAQVSLGDSSWTREEFDYVIWQIENAGGANAALAHGRMTKHTWLLWREQGVVSTDEIQTAHEAVVKDAEERSVIQVTRAAAAFDMSANTTKGSQRQRLAKMTGVEIKQELPRHARPTGEEIEFSMTIDPESGSDVRVPGL